MARMSYTKLYRATLPLSLLPCCLASRLLLVSRTGGFARFVFAYCTHVHTAMPSRRAHTKSRLGCVQCKARRVKVSGNPPSLIYFIHQKQYANIWVPSATRRIPRVRTASGTRRLAYIAKSSRGHLLSQGSLPMHPQSTMERLYHRPRDWSRCQVALCLTLWT